MKNDIRLIERYLNGELSNSQKLEFENRLKTDKILFEELELCKKVSDAIHESDIMELRQTMNIIVQDKPTIMGLHIGRFFYWQIAAAVILAFVVIKSVFFYNSQQNNVSETFSKFYKPYSSAQLMRDGKANSANDSLLNIALTNYENQNYTLAEESFKQIASTDSTNIMAKFYLSITYIEQNKLAEAKENLIELTANNQHLFYEQSLWYLALVYVKEENFNESIKILRLAVQDDFYNSKQAKKLLRELE